MTNCPSYNSVPQELRTDGANLLSTGVDADYSLLKLLEPPPDGSIFLGWDATPVAFDYGSKLYRFSHPKGSPQAYSEQEVSGNGPYCSSSRPRGDYIYSSRIYGATEGGSSGSPVLSNEGKIVGQLYGRCYYTSCAR